mmetsp:Transcript_33245/g.84926  ORF Transcript_33245/g.84926 Transcript_33245/m.84926 type:complete len:425 (-) Transcript_33245:48-1322(-)
MPSWCAREQDECYCGGGGAPLARRSRCWRVYSYTAIAPLTCTLSERMTPSCGISTHVSSRPSRPTGMPSFSRPSSSTQCAGKGYVGSETLSFVCSRPMRQYPASRLFSSHACSACSLTSSMGTQCSAETLMLANAGSFKARLSATTKDEARNTSQVRVRPARFGTLSMSEATTTMCCRLPASAIARSPLLPGPSTSALLPSAREADSSVASTCCPATHCPDAVTGVALRWMGAVLVEPCAGSGALRSIWHIATRSWCAERRKLRSWLRKRVTSSNSGTGAPSNTFTSLLSGPMSCTFLHRMFRGSAASATSKEYMAGASALQSRTMSWLVCRNVCAWANAALAEAASGSAPVSGGEASCGNRSSSIRITTCVNVRRLWLWLIAHGRMAARQRPATAERVSAQRHWPAAWAVMSTYEASPSCRCS